MMAVTDSIFIDVAMTSMKLQVSEFTNIIHWRSMHSDAIQKVEML